MTRHFEFQIFRHAFDITDGDLLLRMRQWSRACAMSRRAAGDRRPAAGVEH